MSSSPVNRSITYEIDEPPNGPKDFMFVRLPLIRLPLLVALMNALASNIL